MGQYVDVGALNSGSNLLSDVGIAGGALDWKVVWGAGMQGSAAMEDAPGGGKRLRVTVTQNPKNSMFYLSRAMPMPAGFVGTAFYVSYRVDTTGTMFVVPYTGLTGVTRALNSYTAGAYTDLASVQTVSFLGRSTGTAYFSNVRLVADVKPQGIFAPAA